ncbi:MAG TPA: hypothetical protein DDW50_08325 [Firmicutes bacterium]|nr:hypothetical protein [Bacillota bacterium]
MSVKNTKPRIPQQQRSIQTKRLIIDAAMKLFSQKGFYNTNSKEIAKEAEVATGCFYAYFSDKKEVFMAALQIYFEQFNEITQTHIVKPPSEKPATKRFFQELIRSFIAAHSVFTDLHHELTAMYYTDPDIQKLVTEYDRSSIDWILKYLISVREHLRVSNPEAAAKVVYWSIHNVIDAIVFSEKENAEVLIAELSDMLERYLFEGTIN